MASTLSEGDRVSWNTPQGRTRGTVEEIRVRDFEHAGQHFTASDDDPAYLVRSERSGALAAHQRSALRRLPG